MTGKLTVFTGGMFAGKTTKLLEETGDGLLIKLDYDNRYSDKNIMTHDGISKIATTINCSKGLMAVSRNQTVIGIDEIQFFDQHYKGNIIDDITNLLTKDVNILVSGLDMDWKGAPFFVTASLLAMADTVVKLQAKCSICNEPATKTFKKISDEKIIDIGENDKYEPRCGNHWTFSK